MTGPHSSMGREPIHSASLAEARKIRSATHDQLAAHAKVCGQCRPNDPTGAAYCDEGWQLAKAYAAARADVAWRQSKIADDHPGLF